MTITLPLDPLDPPKTISKEELYSLKGHPNVDWQIVESEEIDDFLLVLDDEGDEDDEKVDEADDSSWVFYHYETLELILTVGFGYQKGTTKIVNDAMFMGDLFK